jgi:putative transposase
MSEQKATCQTRKRYKTDVADDQWALVAGLIPPAVAKAGREPTDVREILNTILYQNHTGCPWDMLPHDLSPKSTAYDYYKAWQDQGVWGLLVDTLRGRIRVTTPRVGAQAEGPALVDTQAQGRAVAEAQGEGPAAAAGARREETPVS